MVLLLYWLTHYRVSQKREEGVSCMEDGEMSRQIVFAWHNCFGCASGTSSCRLAKFIIKPYLSIILSFRGQYLLITIEMLLMARRMGDIKSSHCPPVLVHLIGPPISNILSNLELKNLFILKLKRHSMTFASIDISSWCYLRACVLIALSNSTGSPLTLNLMSLQDLTLFCIPFMHYSCWNA